MPIRHLLIYNIYLKDFAKRYVYKLKHIFLDSFNNLRITPFKIIIYNRCFATYEDWNV